MKNVGRIQVVVLLKKGGEGGRPPTSVVVTTPFASVEGKERRTVETSGASASVPSRDSEGGMGGEPGAEVVVLGDRNGD
jgi:hypothetical protein